MILGGFQPFSCIDYPGKTCAILFTRGCNFRCAYCHNPELVLPDQYVEEIDMDRVYDFLRERKGLLDAVSITGGEPTLHADLEDVIERIRAMGFAIKLDSNGTRPDVIRRCIKKGIVDYIAMDIKAPIERYSDIVRCSVSADRIRESIRLIIDSGLDHEFRTTIVDSMLSLSDLREIVQEILGARRYYLQRFVSSKTLDDRIARAQSYSLDVLETLAWEFRSSVAICEVR